MKQKTDVFIIADSIYAPLEKNAAANFQALCAGESGVRRHDDAQRSPVPFFASLFNNYTDIIVPGVTPFESLLLHTAKEVITQATIPVQDPRTGFIVSTTKGNISLLEEGVSADDPRLSLAHSAAVVARELGFTSTPVVVSHACISGLVAMITAKRQIEAGLYDQVVVTGADLITRFILSGFQSFQAVADEPCKPFDANRKGINLGEGAAAVVLSRFRPEGTAIRLAGGAVSNDANHISGPSRTGEELYLAIRRAMEEAGVEAADIDMISAHGTATRYNDDMESKAIKLAGLQEVPVNSLKGYYGHTLGAAGLIETVVSVHSMKNGQMIPTRGFEQPGTSENIHVCSTLQPGIFDTCLKTASGFGGCNAAIILETDKLL